MGTATLEERVAKLENKVDTLLQEKATEEHELPWWEKIAGRFENSVEYDEAMRLGREYRESFRPKDDEAKGA